MCYDTNNIAITKEQDPDLDTDPQHSTKKTNVFFYFFSGL
jgi:hypothetical protein